MATPQSKEHVTYRLTPEGKFALILIGIEIPVFAGFAYFVSAAIALGVFITLGVVITAIWTTRKAGMGRWFWVAVAIAGGIQIPIILDVPWANREYRPIYLILAMVDFVAIWGLLKIGQYLSQSKP